MGEIISVFVLILVISILAGLTFLFVSQLKDQAKVTADRTGVTVTNEVISSTNLVAGLAVAGTTALDANQFVLTGVMNGTSPYTGIGVGNATLTSAGVVTNASVLTGYAAGFSINYTYSYIANDDANAYTAVNSTESAGSTVVGYLPLIFLAIIFGAILTLVLRIILPYINLGKDMGGF